MHWSEATTSRLPAPVATSPTSEIEDVAHWQICGITPAREKYATMRSKVTGPMSRLTAISTSTRRSAASRLTASAR